MATEELSETVMDTQDKGLYMAHLHCQSLKNKLDLVKYINSSNFEIFSLSETWLTKHFPDQILDIHGYNIIRLDRSWSMRGNSIPEKADGVTVYVKNEVHYLAKDFDDYNTSCDFK